MVLRHWPTQACYSSILKMIKREPIILKAYAKILTCPNNVNVKSTTAENTDLMACLASGKNL